MADLVTFVDITERKQLEQELLTIGDREQQRLGQDLHDSLGQCLAGISFLSQQLEHQLAAQSVPEASLMPQINHLIKDAITQTRHLA